MKFLLLALALSGSSFDLPFNKARIDSLNAIENHYIFSNVHEAIRLYRRVAEKARSLNYPKGEAHALIKLGMALYMRGDYDESVKVQLRGIRILERLNIPDLLALAYGELGHQMKRRDLRRGIQYMRKGIRIAEKHQLTYRLCGLYDNYGALLEMNSQPDSAEYYYRKALHLKYESKDILGIPFSLNKLGLLYLSQKDFDKARSYLHESDRYRKREKGNYGRIVNLLNWGDFYFALGKLDSAEASFLKALSHRNIFAQFLMVSYAYDRLAQICEKQNDFEKAYISQKKYYAYKDSMLNLQTAKHIAALEIEYETEKKERLLAQQALKIAARNRQLFLMGGAVILLLIAAGVAYKYQHMKRVQLQRELELKTRLKQAEYEQQMAEEKLRISRELHDNIGSQLTFIISSLDNLIYGASDKMNQRLRKLTQFGRRTLKELRNTVWAMKAENEGLDALLMKLNETRRQLNETCQRIHMEIDNQIEEPIQLNSEQMLNLLRITQEALQNAMKHSVATHLIVQLSSDDGHFRMAIRDDGGGFDPASANKGNGLSNMRQRCESAGGRLIIRGENGGTEILCEFPRK